MLVGRKVANVFLLFRKPKSTIARKPHRSAQELACSHTQTHRTPTDHNFGDVEMAGQIYARRPRTQTLCVCCVL